MIDPFSNCMSRTGFQQEVDSDIQKRERSSIIASRLGGKHMSNMGGYVFFGKFTSNNGLRENRVGRRDASGNDE